MHRLCGRVCVCSSTLWEALRKSSEGGSISAPLPMCQLSYTVRLGSFANKVTEWNVTHELGLKKWCYARGWGQFKRVLNKGEYKKECIIQINTVHYCVCSSTSNMLKWLCAPMAPALISQRSDVFGCLLKSSVWRCGSTQELVVGYKWLWLAASLPGVILSPRLCN